MHKTADGNKSDYRVWPGNGSAWCVGLFYRAANKLVGAFGKQHRSQNLCSDECLKAEIEMLALNSRESFEDNKNFLQERIQEEENPAVRKLLELDRKHLDQIQVQMATAREFLILIRILEEKQADILPYLSRIERSLKEQNFSVKRADKEDIKRILAVYYEQNVTTEKFEDIDGERWILPED